MFQVPNKLLLLHFSKYDTLCSIMVQLPLKYYVPPYFRFPQVPQLYGAENSRCQPLKKGAANISVSAYLHAYSSYFRVRLCIGVCVRVCVLLLLLLVAQADPAFAMSLCATQSSPDC